MESVQKLFESSGRGRATCADCGEEYDAAADALLKGIIPGRRRDPAPKCPPCRQQDLAEQEARLEAEREERLERLRLDWRGASGIPRRYQTSRFDGFDATGNEERLRHVVHYAESFELRPKKGNGSQPSLYLCSRANGVGKTHLACAILHRIIDRIPAEELEAPASRIDPEAERKSMRRYRFSDAISLKLRYRQGTSLGAKTSAEEIIAEMTAPRLLVLDDVGKENLSALDAPVLHEMYLGLINERYNAERPIVITSNLPFDTPWTDGGMTLIDLMGRAAVSRLREMCEGRVIELLGQDRR